MKPSLTIAGCVMMIIAMLFFVAGAEQFNLMPRIYANFLGIAAGAVGVLMWVVYGIKYGQSDDDKPE